MRLRQAINAALCLYACACSAPVMRSIEVGYGVQDGALGLAHEGDGNRDIDYDGTAAWVSVHPFAAYEEPSPYVERDIVQHGEQEPAGSPVPDTEEGNAATEIASSPLTVRLLGNWTTGDLTTLAVAAFGLWKAWIEGRKVYRERKDRAEVARRITE